jgi:molecular chaperone Hsp33
VIDPIVEQVPVDDVLHRFMLERAGVRGVLVRLGASWREIASRAEYPEALRDLLGQSVAASALLTGNIKLQGSLSLEFRSAGPLRLLFAECNDEGQLRGLARWEDPLPEQLDLAGLPEALMAITIGHVERGQRYQGLVDLNAPTVAGAIENYFAQSEQLPARILLAADGDHAVGLMLQMLPGEGGHSAVDEDEDDPWARVSLLTDTLGAEEMLNTSPEEILYRLYHEETVRLFEPRELAFGCSCTRERVEAVLRSLGREEVEAALAARDGEIEVICEFCAERYTFDPVDAEHLLADGTIPAPSSTLH